MAENQVLETIIVEDNFPLITVTLNRPKVANAMNLLMVKQLTQILERVGMSNIDY